MNIQLGMIPIEAIKEQGYMAIIHGGAGPADPQGEQAISANESMHHALDRMTDRPPKLHFEYHDMPQSTQAERVAIHAVQLLERDPLFNAGLGAALQADGRARVSASYMESTRRRFSSVANATRVKYPSELAYFLQSQTFSSLDGVGARGLARILHISKSNLITQHQWNRWQETQTEIARTKREAELGSGTVGCVSIDAAGRLAVVTSTGGVGSETVGRLGDTPTTAGNYCAATVGISCTGIGEQILDEAFACKTATRVEDGAPLKEALERGLLEASNRKYHLAAIGVALDTKNGTVHWAAGTTERHFTWGVHLPEGNITAYGILTGEHDQS